MFKKLLTACLLLSLTTFAPAATTGCATFFPSCGWGGNACGQNEVKCVQKGGACDQRPCCSAICAVDDNGDSRCR